MNPFAGVHISHHHRLRNGHVAQHVAHHIHVEHALRVQHLVQNQAAVRHRDEQGR